MRSYSELPSGVKGGPFGHELHVPIPLFQDTQTFGDVFDVIILEEFLIVAHFRNNNHQPREGVYGLDVNRAQLHIHHIVYCQFPFLFIVLDHVSLHDSSMLESKSMADPVVGIATCDEVVSANDIPFLRVDDVGKFVQRNKSLPRVVFKMTFFRVSALDYIMLADRELGVYGEAYISSFQGKDEIEMERPLCFAYFSHHNFTVLVAAIGLTLSKLLNRPEKVESGLSFKVTSLDFKHSFEPDIVS